MLFGVKKMSKEFGETLRTFRRQSELTQKQVAEALHIDRSTYAYYERGTTEPSLNTVVKLAEIFSVPVTELLSKEKGVYAKVSDSRRGVVAPLESKDKTYVVQGSEEDGLLKWYHNLNSSQMEQFREFIKHMNDEKK